MGVAAMEPNRRESRAQRYLGQAGGPLDFSFLARSPTVVVSTIHAISSQISISERAGKHDPDHVFSPGTGPDPKNAENIIPLNRAGD